MCYPNLLLTITVLWGYCFFPKDSRPNYFSLCVRCDFTFALDYFNFALFIVLIYKDFREVENNQAQTTNYPDSLPDNGNLSQKSKIEEWVAYDYKNPVVKRNKKKDMIYAYSRRWAVRENVFVIWIASYVE
ncbi:hypothetical protein BDC45DRAFT_533275 [Circinella umbellata]|nr:hypothetical protein BDC45DRAFT_533275 [Circinella umbellata]